MLLALGSLTLGGLLLLFALGLGLRPRPGRARWSSVGIGVAILWRQADDDARAALAGRDRRRTG